MNKGFICMTCGINKVKRFTKLCENCSEKVRESSNYDNSGVGKRVPTARIVTEEGVEVFVDKNGREVTDHGYDLENDPRGWKRTGTQKPKRTII